MRTILLSVCAAALAACGGGDDTLKPTVVLDTSAGTIEVQVDQEKAPFSAGNFLYYVDNGLYDGQSFYRVVRPETDPRDMGMHLIQGGRADSELAPGTGFIRHEPTSETGFSHTDGAISIARDAVDTGSAAYFFITIGEANTFLDHGGARNPDGQGYAVFGHITSGMDVVRKINAMPSDGKTENPVTQGQWLTEPVTITKAYRK